MKFVSEIFGFNSNFQDLSINERKNYLCPFQKKGTPCDPVNKKSNLIDNDGNNALIHSIKYNRQQGSFHRDETYYKNNDLLAIIFLLERCI